MRRIATPMIFVAAAFTAAGGYVHLREWLDGYRGVPASVPGSVVVRIGFPVNAALSLLVAATLVLTVFVLRRGAPLAIAAALALEAGSLAAVILSRTGGLLGWVEPVWTLGANQSRALAIGALIALCAAVALNRTERRSGRRHPLTVPAPNIT